MSTGLANKRIVNTRAASQANRLDDMLRARQAVPLDYPCISIAPPEDTTALDAALLGAIAGRYDWILFTSANTVSATAQRLVALGLSLVGAALPCAAIGPATAEAIRDQLGLTPIDLPPAFVAEALASSLPVKPGDRILLPESALARPALANLLQARGAQVDVLTAYQTTIGQGGADIPRLLAQKQIDALIFTSSSTVTFFLQRLVNEGGSPQDAARICAACIGPKTAVTAQGHGFFVLDAPATISLDGMLDALDHFFSQQITVSEDLR